MFQNKVSLINKLKLFLTVQYVLSMQGKLNLTTLFIYLKFGFNFTYAAFLHQNTPVSHPGYLKQTCAKHMFE